nr:MAG TPA: hypothetical protein [Caudoviricetes sp.]
MSLNFPILSYSNKSGNSCYFCQKCFFLLFSSYSYICFLRVSSSLRCDVPRRLSNILS